MSSCPTTVQCWTHSKYIEVFETHSTVGILKYFDHIQSLLVAMASWLTCHCPSLKILLQCKTFVDVHSLFRAAPNELSLSYSKECCGREGVHLSRTEHAVTIFCKSMIAVIRPFVWLFADTTAQVRLIVENWLPSSLLATFLGEGPSIFCVIKIWGPEKRPPRPM